jgi:CheY-like chemotaxis protein
MESNAPPLRIAIIEDDAIIALYLSEALEELGYAVVGTAHSGKEALALLGGVQAEVALIDVNLRGGMDGIAVAEELRRRHDLPALFLSGALGTEVMARAAPARPLDFLQKPILPSQLDAALKRHAPTLRLAKP